MSETPPITPPITPQGESAVDVQLGKVPTRWWMWWPLLLGWIGMAVAYGLDRSGPHEYYNKPSLERMAIAVTSACVLAGVIRFAVTRRRFHLLMCCGACVVLLREIHWDWTTKFVYIALAVLAVLGLVWHERVLGFLRRQPTVRVWLVATGGTYVLSQAIARRAFRDVMPNEAEVYSDMEEMIEVLSHLMLYVTLLVGSWRRRGR